MNEKEACVQRRGKLMAGAAVTLIGYSYMILIFFCVIPSVFGYQKYVVSSGSMEPELPVGSCVFVKKEGMQEIAVGDIISYSMTNVESVVTHRVIQCDIYTDSFRTKGDANERADGNLVDYSQILGTVQFCVPLLGYFLVIQSIPGMKVCGIALLLAAASVHMCREEAASVRVCCRTEIEK